MILAIDQGTTGTTCLVFDDEAELVGRAYREFAQHFPQPGWVEHDAGEIWEVTHAVAGEALADAGVLRRASSRRSASRTSARRSCVWDPATGEPLHRAIVWQDRRTAARCDELRAAGHEPLVRDAHRAGARPVLLRHEDRVAARARRRAARAGARRAGGVRDDRHLADASSSPASTSPTRPTRRARCSTTSPTGDWDRRAARAVRRARARAARGARPSRARSGRPGPRRCHGHAVPGRRASPATSRRRCSARPAWTRAWARTPTGRARSCC